MGVESGVGCHRRKRRQTSRTGTPLASPSSTTLVWTWWSCRTTCPATSVPTILDDEGRTRTTPLSPPKTSETKGRNKKDRQGLVSVHCVEFGSSTGPVARNPVSQETKNEPVHLCSRQTPMIGTSLSSRKGTSGYQTESSTPGHSVKEGQQTLPDDRDPGPRQPEKDGKNSRDPYRRNTIYVETPDGFVPLHTRVLVGVRRNRGCLNGPVPRFVGGPPPSVPLGRVVRRRRHSEGPRRVRGRPLVPYVRFGVGKSPRTTPGPAPTRAQGSAIIVPEPKR